MGGSIFIFITSYIFIITYYVCYRVLRATVWSEHGMDERECGRFSGNGSSSAHPKQRGIIGGVPSDKAGQVSSDLC